MPYQDQSRAIVQLCGEISVRTIADARQKLSDAFRHNDSIIVDVAEIAEADLTLVQLMESARRAAAEQGKHFSLSAPASGALLETLKRGGFVDPQTSDGSNFWIHGMEDC